MPNSKLIEFTLKAPVTGMGDELAVFTRPPAEEVLAYPKEDRTEIGKPEQILDVRASAVLPDTTLKVDVKAWWDVHVVLVKAGPDGPTVTIRQFVSETGQERVFVVREKQEKPLTVPGEIWQLALERLRAHEGR